MKVARLTIEHFRCIEKSVLYFEGHTLLVGMNNVGKSTVCEALDLVLGPDRLSRFPPVEEFDFYNARYLADDGATAIPSRVEVVITNLNEEIVLSCPTHIEFWHVPERRLLTAGEADKANGTDVIRCLRLETLARYDSQEDEFEADTFFCHGTSNVDDSPERVSKRVKRLFGFLYLRTLRTGSRALSLERGSLLDIILKMQGVRTGLWERSIERLRELDPPIAVDALDLAPVLDSIEKRLAQYIPLDAPKGATRLFVSQLTREHLRKTISFFLSTAADQEPVPFQEVGTGTLNILVLALLSFIAEAKKDNVIFAMEEPEIALPPHTQRRVANYLLNETTQCFVTSHSPYVIERFDPDQILILRRDESAAVTATPIILGGNLKSKHYRRHARRGLAEAMLGRAVIVTEGITEHLALAAAAEKLEAAYEEFYPLDLSGITIFPVDGDGALPSFGAFFQSLGLQTFGFYDQKSRTAEEAKRLRESFYFPFETGFTGMEQLLVTEVPVARQWQFLEGLRQRLQAGKITVPPLRPDDEGVKELMLKCLKSNKGSGYAADLIGMCDSSEIPPTIEAFLLVVYGEFPKPAPAPIPSPSASNGTAGQPTAEAAQSDG